MAMVFPFLLLFISAVGTVDGGSCRRDDQSLLQFEQGHAGKIKRSACDTTVPWPCGNEIFSQFPIQLINSGSTAGNFDRLNLTDGTYLPLCISEEATLNACGINPVDNGIYCITRANNDDTDDFFVRVNCDFTGWSPGDDPVQGDVCWFGPSNNSFAGAFDEDGNYFFKTDDEGNGIIRNISAADIAGFMVFDTADEARNTNQVFDASQLVLENNQLNALADFNILKIDLGPTFGGVGEQEYLIGCQDNEVRVQCLTCDNVETNPKANFTRLVMFGTAAPTGSSGAQWLYGQDTEDPLVFCAYNNGMDGVIQVNITQADGKKYYSDETGKK